MIAAILTTFDRIIVAETREAALVTMRRVVQFNREFVVQRYIAEANREVVRVLGVDGRAIDDVLRRAEGSDVLPNWNFPATPHCLDTAERPLSAKKRQARLTLLSQTSLCFVRITIDMSSMWPPSLGFSDGIRTHLNRLQLSCSI